MTSRHSWAPRYNELPVNHLRVSLNSRIDPDPLTLLAFANALVNSLKAKGFENIALVHVGRGSTSVELSVDREKAELLKLQIETDKLKAETRLTNLKTIVGSISALYAAAVTMGIDVSEAAGNIGAVVQNIAIQCGASTCKFSAGELAFDVAIPLEVRDATHARYTQTEDFHVDDLQIIREDNSVASATVVIPNDTQKNNWVQFHGVIVATDSLFPIVKTESGNYVLHGLQELLPIADGTPILFKAIVHHSGSIHPIRIEVT